MNKTTESTIEQIAPAWLESLGYQVATVLAAHEGIGNLPDSWFSEMTAADRIEALLKRIKTG